MPMTRAGLLPAIVLLACGGQQASPPAVTVARPASPAVDAGASPVDGPMCAFEPARPAEPRRTFKGFGTKRREQPDPDGPGAASCQVADSNIVVAMDTVLQLPAAKPGPRRAAWDHRTKPANFDLVAKRFNLNAEERQRLYRDGFVVPARFEQPSYGWAYHEIYQSQLPVYITVDSILNAVYAAHDGIVSGIERRELEPRLKSLLATLHCKLPAVAGRYPDEVARDLDLYLTVARTLLGDKVASAFADDAITKRAGVLVANAQAAGPMKVESLFGRDRVVDWSQYQPRGHYAKDRLEAYFRAVMWLSRIELNIVSRSSRSSHPGMVPDPSETPRETVVALALADLVEASGQSDALARFEDVFALLAGTREDIPLPALAKLAKAAGVSDLRAANVAATTRAAVGNQYQRQARIHYMPEGSKTLPAIATFIGPRITADTIALRELAHSEVRDKHHIRATEIAYLLGHDRGKHHLKTDLATYPTLAAQLDVARQRLAAAPRGADPNGVASDLYTAWLDAIRAIAVEPQGTAPSFTDTSAYRDLRVNTTVAAYAQLRHNHVLIAGQAYGEGGCRIPDGFVEPAPAVYDALARYGELGAQKMTLLDGHADAEREYFLRLAKIARTLATISRHELANQPLPATALGFLGMVSEMLPYGSDGRPTYTGWYFDLFHDRADAVAKADLIADFFTSMQGVSYAGVQAPTMGIFVVDTGGKPRVVVGPVARAYEYQGPQSPRLDDKAARALDDRKRTAPWAASYGLPKPPEPSFAATFQNEWGEGWTQTSIVVEAPAALGNLTIELRDHHRVTTRKLTRAVRAGKTVFAFPRQKQTEDGGNGESAEFLVFTTGKFFAESELKCMEDGCAPIAFGSMRKQYPSYDSADE